MMNLTRDEFEEFKRDYDVYGTHTETDKYRNERRVRDETPKGSIHVMWHPLSDAVALAEYGKDIERMLYCVLYDDIDVKYNDVVIINNDEYEVSGIKRYNTHINLEVSRKKVQP